LQKKIFLIFIIFLFLFSFYILFCIHILSFVLKNHAWLFFSSRVIGGWKPEYPEENHPSQSLKEDNQCLKKKSKLEDMINKNKFFLTESNSFISLYASSGKSSNCFLTYAILYATTFPPLLSTFPPLLFRFLHYFLILIPSSVVTNLM